MAAFCAVVRDLAANQGDPHCKRTGTGLIRFASHHRPCICSVVFVIVVANFVVIVVIVVVSSRE
jgi:hypothetical protein